MQKLVGIARLAADSRPIEEKRQIEYRELSTRSFLTRCDSTRVPFSWTINPYRGCEFGCKYCYARYAHEFMELRDPSDFEHKIFVKQFNPFPFREELRKIPLGESIALGTATDPYQPAERRYLITHAILRVFSECSGYRLSMITKSNLIPRDIDLLSEVARRHYLSIAITITTTKPELARLIEPLAPCPDLRLGAVSKLSQAGLRTRVYCAPVLPLINDDESSLDALASAASKAGACGFGGSVLFLKPCSSRVFFPFLEQRFPHLARRYRERFERDAYLRGDYQAKIRERIRRVSRRYWFDHAQPESEPELWPQDPQLLLFRSP